MPGTDEVEPLEDLDRAADEYAHADARSRARLREDFVGQALPFAGRLARRFRGRGSRSRISSRWPGWAW